MRIALALVALVLASPAMAVAGYAPAKTLLPSVEAAWVGAVESYKTDDDTTVLQTLEYAERLRPTKFKLGSFEAGYNGATGDPEAVAIDFWIGAKRAPGDAFSILFEVRDAGGKITVQRPKTQYGGTAAEAVVSGRAGMLRFIDEQYRENCIDADSAKLC